MTTKIQVQLPVGPKRTAPNLLYRGLDPIKAKRYPVASKT
jgi:hypothetical protein